MRPLHLSHHFTNNLCMDSGITLMHLPGHLDSLSVNSWTAWVLLNNVRIVARCNVSTWSRSKRTSPSCQQEVIWIVSPLLPNIITKISKLTNVRKLMHHLKKNSMRNFREHSWPLPWLTVQSLTSLMPCESSLLLLNVFYEETLSPSRALHGISHPDISPLSKTWVPITALVMVHFVAMKLLSFSLWPSRPVWWRLPCSLLVADNIPSRLL